MERAPVTMSSPYITFIYRKHCDLGCAGAMRAQVPVARLPWCQLLHNLANPNLTPASLLSQATSPMQPQFHLELSPARVNKELSSLVS